MSVMERKISKLPMPGDMTVEEIRRLIQEEEYGYLPAAPISMKVEEKEEGFCFCAGNAVLKKLTFHCETEMGMFTFPVSYTCRTDKKPAPLFIHINFRNLVPDRYEPSEELVDAGYAVMSFCYQDVATDNDDFTKGLAGILFPEGRTEDTQCGKIMMWVWAAMRVIDYAQTLPEIRPDRICVAGHSRLGKTALLTGAMDDRVYCAFSNDSGCSGASIARGNRGETVRDIWERFSFWFNTRYQKYMDNEYSMPFDQHYLLAANAPHLVYVASAIEDWWADPANEYLSCVAASEYHKSKGLAGFIHPDRPPFVGDFFPEGSIGYHLRPGKHYFSRNDWNHYIKFLALHEKQKTEK